MQQCDKRFQQMFSKWVLRIRKVQYYSYISGQSLVKQEFMLNVAPINLFKPVKTCFMIQTTPTVVQPFMNFLSCGGQNSFFCPQANLFSSKIVNKLKQKFATFFLNISFGQVSLYLASYYSWSHFATNKCEKRSFW